MKNIKKILGVFVIVMALLLCVPNSVKAAEMSDEFKSYLNKDGKLVVNSIRVDSGIEFVFEYLFSMDENGEYLDNGICYDVAEDMNSVDFTIHCWEEDKKETHNVEIVYTYDEEVKKQVAGYLNKIPEDLEYFEVRDLEVVNYWVNGGNIIDYSSQLKSLFDYKNFKMDFRAGGGDRFSEEAIGNAQFMYDGTVYGIREHTGISAKHIIYIDESVGNTKEEVVAAVQKRIDDYLGKDKVSISYEGTGIYDLFVDEYTSSIEYFQKQYDDLSNEMQRIEESEERYCRTDEQDDTLCQYYQSQRGSVQLQLWDAERELNANKMYKESFIECWNTTDGGYDFLKDAYNDWYFIAEIDFGDYVAMYEFIVIRDSSKMIKPSIKTTDVSTNVEISTNAALPLDTTIQAKELTSGDEYERIVSLLNLTDNLTFDLKLYSGSIEKYITKLDDGTFEVKIPVPDNFKDKDLMVYYVDENGGKEPYTVELDDDKKYAIFNTTHFSVYTLGYEETAPTSVKVTFDANGGKFGKENVYVINDWKAELYDSLTKPTRKGYTFKGYYTEKTGGTKFEMILNEAGIDNNAVFYAQWEKDITNPQTFDDIGNNILMGTISLIGLIGTTVYLIKKKQIKS